MNYSLTKVRRTKETWQDQEREFRSFRDPKQRVTLPRLKCLDVDESLAVELLDPCES